MSSLQDCGFAPLEQDFADLMVRLAPEGGKSLYWAAAHAMRAVLQNHVCCDLAQMIVPDDVPHNWQEILQKRQQKSPNGNLLYRRVRHKEYNPQGHGYHRRLA